jgi:hypothetical protein
MEEWARILDFPDYMVSSYGQVMNIKRDFLLERSQVQGGAVRVNLYHNGRQGTRSVKVLVAEAFVPRPESYESQMERARESGLQVGEWTFDHSPEQDTPIQLDNHELNLRADNLAWRTRSFAWNYKRQFHELSDVHTVGPVQDVDSGTLYRDIYDAATANGLLFKDVWRCAQGYTDRVWPTGQRILLVRHLNEMEMQR